MDFDFLAVLVSFGSVVASAVLSFFKNHLSVLSMQSPVMQKVVDRLGRAETPKSKPEETEPPKNTAHALAQRRLAETTKAYRRERFMEYFARVSNGLLVFAQYVIGGLLLSSFVQETLDARLVGYLGIVVLFATIVNQKYRPDVSASISKAKASWLYAAILRVENKLALVDPSAANSKIYQEAIDLLTETLVTAANPDKWNTVTGATKVIEEEAAPSA